MPVGAKKNLSREYEGCFRGNSCCSWIPCASSLTCFLAETKTLFVGLSLLMLPHNVDAHLEEQSLMSNTEEAPLVGDVQPGFCLSFLHVLPHLFGIAARIPANQKEHEPIWAAFY